MGSQQTNANKYKKLPIPEQNIFLNTQPCVDLIIIGVGNRGSQYIEFALEYPKRCRIVGIAEPRDAIRNRMQKRFQLKDSQVFKDWKEVAAQKKFADAVVICLQDKMHMEPAVKFADLGYHILLEKPMAVNEEDCKKIVAAVEKNNVILGIAHVLRYTPVTQKLKEMLDSGILGDILHIQHMEQVGYFHYAHSYVRGNWRNTKDSTFMLMAKSCHDIDWIYYIMNKKVKKVSSFGSLKHFKKENKPKGASDRCLTCSVEETCPYSAKKIYLDAVRMGIDGWPVNVIVSNGEIPDIENVTQSLKTTNYGKCVYDVDDHDVVDNQVVNMEFEDGATATFSMISTTNDICIRRTRIFGSKGEIEVYDHEITHIDFLTLKKSTYKCYSDVKTRLMAHGKADFYLMHSFVAAVQTKDPSWILSGPKETLTSHLLVFAAEKSRLEGKVINTEDLN